MENTIGELLILGFRGLSVPEWLQEFAERYSLGGAILFDYDVETKTYGRNIVSPEQTKSLCRSIVELKSSPLVFIDQEGGRVRRLKEALGFKPWVSALEFSKLKPKEQRDMVMAAMEEMRQLGIHFDLAPVADINSNPDNPDIGASSRAFSANPKEIEACIEVVNAAAKEWKIGLCLKHFPGLGRATTNSHLELTDLSGLITAEDEQIFYRLLPSLSQSAVLISHAIISEWDRGIPASVSKEAVTRLRSKVPDCLIITDDLQMQGLQKAMGSGEACLRAVAAGADMLILGNNLLWEAEECFDIAKDLVDTSRKNPKIAANIRASLDRIGRRKKDLLRA